LPEKIVQDLPVLPLNFPILLLAWKGSIFYCNIPNPGEYFQKIDFFYDLVTAKRIPGFAMQYWDQTEAIKAKPDIK
jgi:hypothetical protein